MNAPTEATSTTSIEDLPTEMISELFKHLPPKDLAACSLVNKRWHFIYSNFKLYSLVVTDNENVSHEWYDSNQTIEKKCFCRPAMFLHLAEKPLLSNLKHLAIYKYDLEFDFNELNNFQHLVYLEIDSFPYDQTKVHLNLPKLKVLVFDYFIAHCAVSINCPRLNTLVYREGDVDLLEVKHPETIRKLVTDMFGTKLTPFKGVECLVTEEFGAISSATLLSLPKLRELRYNESIAYLYKTEFRGAGTVDRMRRALSGFVDELKKLKGSDFHFELAGFQLSKTILEQIDFVVQVVEEEEEPSYEWVYNEYVYMKNYHLIEPGVLHFVRRVNYTRMLRHVTGEFPRCFSQKFTDIEWVYATAEVQDADHFLWFLNSLRTLKRIVLEDSELSQEFYDLLPASAPSLNELVLEEGHCEDGLQVNFDFIGRLPRLAELIIQPAISSESVTSILRSFRKSARCFFYVRSEEERFSIQKEKDSTAWQIFESPHKPYEFLFESENPEEIVNFIERLQKNTPERSAASD